MVLDWGMSEHLGHMALGGRSENVFLGEQIAQRRDYSEDTAREVDKEIKAILDQSYGRALDTLQEHREQLDRVARTLREKEELTGQEVVDIIGLEQGEGETPLEQEPVHQEAGH
jgi:cell division protease FtsH